MTDRQLIWVETCPECEGRCVDWSDEAAYGDTTVAVSIACHVCLGTGELRTELTDAERVAWERARVREDDETAIDSEWLKSVRFLKDGGDGQGFPLALTLLYDRTEYDLNNGLGEGRQLIIDASGDTAIEEYDEDGTILGSVSTPTCKTRGQLRRLCEALGVRLEEIGEA